MLYPQCFATFSWATRRAFSKSGLSNVERDFLGFWVTVSKTVGPVLSDRYLSVLSVCL